MERQQFPNGDVEFSKGKITAYVHTTTDDTVSVRLRIAGEQVFVWYFYARIDAEIFAMLFVNQ